MPVGRRFMVQTPHLGPAGNVRTFNQSALPLGGQLGQIHEEAGAFWRLCQFHWSDVDTIDGGVAYWEDYSVYDATADADDAEILSLVAGFTHVVLGTASNNNYWFVQVGGEDAAVVVASSTVTGDMLTGHISTDNVLTRTANAASSIDVNAAVAFTSRASHTSAEGATVTNASRIRILLGNLI